MARDRGDVAAEIRHHSAAAGGIHPEVPRRRRVRHVVFGVDAAKGHDVADLAAGHDVAREGHERILDVVEPDLGFDAGPFRRLGHVSCLCGGRSQRLFAMHVLAGGNRRERNGRVECIRRGDADDVDLRIGDQRAPVADRARESEIARGCRGQSGVASASTSSTGWTGMRNTPPTVRYARLWALPMKPEPTSPMRRGFTDSPFADEPKSGRGAIGSMMTTLTSSRNRGRPACGGRTMNGTGDCTSNETREEEHIMTNQTLAGAVRLDGRIAIVTGGTQGLGEAIASDFVERGAKGIVICGRSGDKRPVGCRTPDQARLQDRIRQSRPERRSKTAARSSRPPIEPSDASTSWSTPRPSPIAARSSTPRPSCSTRCSRSTCGRRSS